MKMFSIGPLSLAMICSAGLLTTSAANADSSQNHLQNSQANDSASQWVVDFRGKPPFKRTRIHSKPNSEQPPLAGANAASRDQVESHNRFQIGPRGKNKVTTRYRNPVEVANETAQFARFEEVSDPAQPAKRCKRRSAPGKSMPVRPSRC